MDSPAQLAELREAVRDAGRAEPYRVAAGLAAVAVP